LIAAYADSDFEKMEEVRARVEAIVADRETAERLKPWYRQLCKRPCFHDEYLQSFNNPSCRLIDTDGQGVERITEKGFVVAGIEYEVDCIIYASGFEVGTDYTRRSGFDMSGRDGLKLSAAWAEGMRTMHGIHSRGFPNAFYVQAFQGAALISNVPHNLADAAKTIALTVRQVLDSGNQEVEVTQQAQDAWIELLVSGPARALGSPDCTPGYYNNEGHPPSPTTRYNLGYPRGPHAFFRYMEQWRDAGTFDGLEFR
jgi:cyclohexanone monooxygenase